MKKLIAALALGLIAQPVLAEEAEAPKWSLAIHGGAGTLDPKAMTPERRAAYEAALQQALDAGAKVLAEGGSAMDAIKAAIIPMEDSPLFNAGKGAVFTWEGTNELDSSIMDGRDRSAGAIAGVETVKNPILLADTVRAQSEHVMLMGAGAEALVDNAEQAVVTARMPKGRHQMVEDAFHEILMETDTLRAPFWQAFDALADEVAP